MTQDQALHPLLASFVAYLEEAGYPAERARSAAVTQTQRWRETRRGDDGESLPRVALDLLEHALQDVNGGVPEPVWVSAEAAEAVAEAAGYQEATTAGLLDALLDRDPVVQGRAVEAAVRLLGPEASDVPRELHGLLLERARPDAVIAQGLRGRKKLKAPMIRCPSCNATRLATTACPVCHAPPVAQPPEAVVKRPEGLGQSEEQIAAGQRVGTDGVVIVESTFDPLKHPRGRGGRWAFSAHKIEGKWHAVAFPLHGDDDLRDMQVLGGPRRTRGDALADAQTLERSAGEKGDPGDRSARSKGRTRASDIASWEAILRQTDLPREDRIRYSLRVAELKLEADPANPALAKRVEQLRDTAKRHGVTPMGVKGDPGSEGESKIAQLSRLYHEGKSLPTILKEIGHDEETLQLVHLRLGVSMSKLRRTVAEWFPELHEAAGAGLSARGQKRTPPAQAPPAPGSSNFNPDLHPRSQGGAGGGRFIAKGEGLKGAKDGGPPSDRVKQLQARLAELGFQTAQDGQFGLHTEEAVKAFQRKYGLPETGQVDAKTVEMMRNPPKITAQQARQQIAGTAGAGVRQAARLQQQVEQTLNALGYDYGGADTAKSLETLQRLYGIQPTGHPDHATQALLARLQGRSVAADRKAGQTGNLSAEQRPLAGAGKGKGMGGGQRLQHAATEGSTEEGEVSASDTRIEEAFEDLLGEASYSSGGFDTNTPVRQAYGGVNGLGLTVKSGKGVGGQPEFMAPSLLADPDDRTPGMDDFMGDEPVRMPPNLREAPAHQFQSCATCVHHNGKKLCALYSAGTDKDDLCDSWYSLTPEEQQRAVQVYIDAEGQLSEARESRDGSAVAVAARRIEHVRELVEKSVGGGELDAMVAKFTAKGMPKPAAEKAARRALARKRIQEAGGHVPPDEAMLDEPDAAEALSGWLLGEAELTAEKRKKLSKGDFAIPGEEKYPIHDEAHARNALARVSQHGTPEEKKKVRAAVKRKHPGVVQEAARLVEVKSSAYPSLERKPGKQNWVDYAGGLPSYIERVAKHIHYEGGKPIGTAIAMAVGTMRRWCAGGSVSKGGASTANVKGGTKAKACAALAEWEAKKKKGGAAQRASNSIREAVMLDGRTAAVFLALQEIEALEDPVPEVSLEEAVELVEAMELREAAYPLSLHFDPHLHPRDRQGQFTDVLARMMKAGRGAEATLPHGVAVRKRAGGRLTVSQGGRKLGSFSKPDKAAARALAATGIPDPKHTPTFGVNHPRYRVAYDPAEHKVPDMVQRALSGDLKARKGKNMTVVPGHLPNTATVSSYHEPIAHIDHGERRVFVSAHGYSNTTAQHRGIIERAAKDRGYSVSRVDRAESRRRAGLDPSVPFVKTPAGVKADPGDTFNRHELRVAKDTLKMHPGIAGVMGGPSPEQAFATVKRLTGSEPRRQDVHAGHHEKLFGTKADQGTWLNKGEGQGEGVMALIRSGDRVTIRTPQGQERSGKAVMRGPHGWVLNLGGAHGTPGIADERNIVKHKGVRYEPGSKADPGRPGFARVGGDEVFTGSAPVKQNAKGEYVWSGSRIEGLRYIGVKHQAVVIDGHLVDAQTANLLVQVHDALSPENQAKFEKPSMPKLVAFAWKQVKSDPGVNFDPAGLGAEAASRHELEHQRGYADASAGRPRALGTAHWYGRGYSQYLDERMHAGEARARIENPEAWKGVPTHPPVERAMAELRRSGVKGDPGSAWTPEATPGGPLWRYKDNLGIERTGRVVKTSDYGGTDVTYFFRRADSGQLDVLSGPYIKRTGAGVIQGQVEMPKTATFGDLPEGAKFTLPDRKGTFIKTIGGQFRDERGLTHGGAPLQRVVPHHDTKTGELLQRASAGAAADRAMAAAGRKLPSEMSDQELRSALARKAADTSASKGSKLPVTLHLGLIPQDWAVEHGYATTRPGMTRPYGNANTGTNRAKPTDNFMWKPGIDRERVMFHYLYGKLAPPNFAPGSVAHEQWTYKPKGKKADRLPVIKRLTEVSLGAVAEALTLFVPESPHLQPMLEVEAESGLGSARLPVAQLLIEDAARMPDEIADELRRRLELTCSKDETARRLAEARAANDTAKVGLYETLTEALG